jgi:hypothetical protein
VKRVFAERPIVEVRATRPVEAMKALDAMPDVEKTSLFGTAVHGVLRSRETGVAEIRARLAGQGLEVLAIDTVPPSLEDVFLDVVDRAQAREPGA